MGWTLRPEKTSKCSCTSKSAWYISILMSNLKAVFKMIGVHPDVHAALKKRAIKLELPICEVVRMGETALAAADKKRLNKKIAARR